MSYEAATAVPMCIIEAEPPIQPVIFAALEADVSGDGINKGKSHRSIRPISIP